MFNITTELERIKTMELFANLGKGEDSADVIFIRNVEEAFINPAQKLQPHYEQIIWLPTSIYQDDPFYSHISWNEEIFDARRKMNQILLMKFKELDEAPFIWGPHDFVYIAKSAVYFAFRQYLAEQLLRLGLQWSRFIALYYNGHWPIGYTEQKIIAI